MAQKWILIFGQVPEARWWTTSITAETADFQVECPLVKCIWAECVNVVGNEIVATYAFQAAYISLKLSSGIGL